MGKSLVYNMNDSKFIGDNTLDRIIEECDEVIQACIKGRRFGWYNRYPEENSSTNLIKLDMKIQDVIESYEDFKQDMKKRKD